MKALLAMLFGMLPLVSADVARAQSGGMMDGGGWMSGYGGMGGYGGILVPVLLVIVVIGVVMWFIKTKGK